MSQVGDSENTTGAFRKKSATEIAPSLLIGGGEPLASSGFFESDGLQIYYESYGGGEGHPIVLVHGWGSDLNASWVATGWVDALQRERQVIALDVRGHGESDRPLQQSLYSYSAMARDVLSLMDTFGISRADFMGYSMGAFMGAHLLGHHSERFDAMVLGGIGNETEESVAIVDLIAEALRADGVSEITNPIGIAYRRFVDRDSRNDPEGREALALAALQMWPEGFPIELGGPGIGNVDNPVLIVNGAADFPYVDTHQDLVSAIPGARLVTIPGQDHLGTVTDPLFKDEVLAFLEG